MTEQQPYRVESVRDGFEVRRYPPAVLARVPGGAVSSAFRTLFSYITGGNERSEKISMTAPVLEESGMFAFVMPHGSTLTDLPAPRDPLVTMTQTPEELVAAVRFSGRWTEGGFRKRATELEARATAAGFEIVGPARFARYDPPWTPWFLRRNEVLIPVVERPAI